MGDAVALNLHARRDGYHELRSVMRKMLDSRALLRWEYDALYALVESLGSQRAAVAQDRQRHGFVR